MIEIEEDPCLEALLLYLQANRGFDLTGYKRFTLARRIAKRLAEVQCENIFDDIDLLEVHPDEFEHLFNTVLINLTSFFRDLDAWTFLDDEAIGGLLSSKGHEE
jgi:two-component system CheB/CheR fusion protein